MSSLKLFDPKMIDHSTIKYKKKLTNEGDLFSEYCTYSLFD
jgi:hypothetical protein